eukprot:s831_g2.t2
MAEVWDLFFSTYNLTHNSNCGDLVFSGHTDGVFLIVTVRNHYTVDVVIAAYLAPLNFWAWLHLAPTEPGADCSRETSTPRSALTPVPAGEADGRALQCADDELKRDRKFLLKALVNKPQALDFVHPSLRFDPELVKIALGQEYHPPKSPPSPKERAQSPGFPAKPKPKSRRSRRALSLERMERERQRKLQQAAEQRPHSAPEDGAELSRSEPVPEPAEE